MTYSCKRYSNSKDMILKLSRWGTNFTDIREISGVNKTGKLLKILS